MTEPTAPAVALPTRASFANSTTRALAESMTQQNEPLSVTRRWGLVQAINADDTLDVTLSGELLSGVRYDASYAPAVGETVFMDVVGADVVVMGTMAPSLLNPGHRRASVTAVNTTRTKVTITVDDGTVLSDVPALAPYIPHVGDVVHALSYLGEFVVAGSVSDTVQQSRRGVGHIEASLTTKPGTLALQGQTVSRAAYPQLFAWATANNLISVTPGLFGPGDGSTTFVLPNFAGRVPVGAGTLGADAYTAGALAGAARATLTTAQMPSHNHAVAVAAHATHDHNVTVPAHGTHDHSVTGSIGSDTHSHVIEIQNSNTTLGDHTHTGMGGTVSEGANPKGTGTPGPAATETDAHTHSLTLDAVAVSAGSHPVTESLAGPTTHTVTETTVGGTTAVDIRQPVMGVHFVIWT